MHAQRAANQRAINVLYTPIITKLLAISGIYVYTLITPTSTVLVDMHLDENYAVRRLKQSCCRVVDNL